MRASFLVSVVAVLLMWSIFAAVLLRERKDALNDARLQANNLTLVAERDIARSLELYDLSLRAIADAWARPDILDLPPEIRRDLTFDRAIEARHIFSAAVLDATGKVVANLKIDAALGRDFSARAFFQSHLHNADDQMHISSPTLSNLDTSVYYLALTRRIVKDGSFGGVALLLLDVNYFRELLQGLDIGRDGRTSLFDAHGRVVMSLPYMDGLIGKDRSGSDIVQGMANKTSGSFITNSLVDGKPRLIVFRTVAGTGIKVSVSPALADIYAPWVRRATATGTAAGALGISLVALAWLLGRALSGRQQAERARAAQENRLRAITDNLPALIAYIDRDERYQFANRTFMSWLGRDPATLLGKKVSALMPPELHAVGAKYFERAMAGERVEFESEGAPMGIRRVTQNVYLPDLDEHGKARGIYTLSVDVTPLKDVQSKLAEQARVDHLTGLPNRLAIGELLPQALARAARTDDSLALLFLDIDHFKRINDTLGHAAGDTVLVEFAKRLRTAVRLTDTVARLAGDEFVVLLEAIGERDAAGGIAQKIGDLVANEPFMAEGTSISVTASIGIAWQPKDVASISAERLLARADTALYDAKARGRNRFEFAV